MVNNRVEKYAIYSKGFRGLPDGWHNIRACNFLVGENSSGKSSFLQLIELIDSREHMVLLDICGVVEGLDVASDIASRLSGARQVTIGFLIKEAEDLHKEKRTSTGGPYLGRLVTYRLHKEQLVIDKITLISGFRALRLKNTREGICYRFDSFPYQTQKSHVENGARLEALHFSKSRFKRTLDDYDSSLPDSAIWIDAIRAASTSSSDRKNQFFMRAYPPLNCLHYGPMRAKTRRLYYGNKYHFSSSGEHIAYVMREFLESHDDLKQSIESFGRDSGLFDEISVSTVKTRISDKPFALQIKKANAHFYVDELGYGVGQILPIIADLAFTSGGNSFLIQQPELHLHPRAQAALGDVFVSACNAGATLVIETHSDFIIDRFRMRSKLTEFDKRSQIVYFSKSKDGKNLSSEIELFADGTMSEAPDGYRSFFLNESIEKIEALL